MANPAPAAPRNPNIVSPCTLPRPGVYMVGYPPDGARVHIDARTDACVAYVLGVEVGRWSRKQEIATGVVVDWRLLHDPVAL